MSVESQGVAGIARVEVTDNGKSVYRDAMTITKDHVLRELSIPLEYGGLFSSHKLEIVVKFEPGVRP